VNPERIAELCADLTLLKFFPSDPAAAGALLLLVGRMASNEDQVRWLVKRTLELYDEWPGPRTFRGIFCQKYKPREGADLRCIVTEKYPDGIPSEKAIEAPRLALRSGREFTADAKLESAVETTFQQMPRIDALPKHPPTAADRRFDAYLKELATAPCDREVSPVSNPQPVAIPPVGPNGQFVKAWKKPETEDV
jgi:hypothetical protein